MKGKAIMEFLKTQEITFEKSDNVAVYAELELLSKYKEKARRAFDERGAKCREAILCN